MVVFLVSTCLLSWEFLFDDREAYQDKVNVNKWKKISDLLDQHSTYVGGVKLSYLGKPCLEFI